MAYTHGQWSPKGKLSQLDSILGPKANMCETYICNREIVCSTWDHHPVYAVAHKEKKRDGAP